MGKKPAMTVVAKAELAQSYKAQLHADLFNFFDVGSINNNNATF
ncbi:MAG: hypothetical protein NZ824_05575 [Candidatus Thioglobus sp.]|jgi:hypothetical protein|nr:hypothetical protein [Candidatus Thioglobus sp.]